MKNFGYVMATKKLVDEKLPVRFMFREEGSAQDSGWRFFSGTEDQDYVDDPANIGIYDVETILGIDKSVRPYLSSAVGMAFEKGEGDATFRVVEDFAFGEDLGEE